MRPSISQTKSSVQSKVFVCIGVCLLFYFKVEAQFSVSGHVFDSATMEPLSFVSVTLNTHQDTTLIDYRVTRANGWFLFEEVVADSVLLVVDALGYVAEYFTVDRRRGRQVDTIWLNAARFDLETVEVKAYKSGIILNGDTITYAPSVYTSGREETVEEVLKKLPGITVEEDGSVKFGNKEVKELLIDGDDFLDTNRKGLLKGIHAIDVEAIEVIQNYNPTGMSVLSSNRDGDVAINIKLSDMAKSKTRYRASLGGGYENKYDFVGELYRIKQKFKFFVNTHLDNTGQHQLSLFDYLKLNGGAEGFANKAASSNAGAVPKIFFQKSRSTSVASQYISANFSYKPMDALKINGYTLAYGAQNSLQSFSEEAPLNQGILNTFSSLSKNSFQNYMGKIAVSYRPASKLTFDFSAYTSIQKEEGSVDSESNLNGLNFASRYRNTSPQLTSSGQASLQYSMSPTSLLRAYVQADFTAIEREISLESDSVLHYDIANAAVRGNAIGQELENARLSLDYAVSYIKQVRHYSLSTTASYQSENQSLSNSGITGFEVPSISTTSRLTRNYFLWSNELEYSKPFFDAGIGIHYLATDFQRPRSSNEGIIYPSAFVSVNFARLQQKIKLKYNEQFNLIEVPIALQSFELQSINKLFLFDEASSILLRKHNLQLQYHLFDAFSGTMLFLFSNYASGISLGENVQYFPTYELRSAVVTPTEKVFFNGAILDKKIAPIKLGLKSKLFVGAQQDFVYVFDELQELLNTNLKFNLAAYTTREEKVNLEGGVGVDYGRFGTKQLQATARAVNCSFKLLSKSEGTVDWKIGTVLFWEQQNERKNLYTNILGELRFKPSTTKLQASLVFNDILNINSATRITASQIGNNYRFSAFDTLPGFLLLKLSYRH
jgi:hypothetical protein